MNRPNQIQLSLDKELEEHIKALGIQYNVPKSVVVRAMLRAGVDTVAPRDIKYEKELFHSTFKGRPRKPMKAGYSSVFKRVMQHEITSVKAMKILGLKKTTYYKLFKEYRETLDK